MFEIGQVDLMREKQICQHDKSDVKRLRSFRMSIAKLMGTPYYEIDPEWQFKHNLRSRL